MELKSISFLRNDATEEFIDSYVNYLVTEWGWEEPQIRLILNEIKEMPDFSETSHSELIFNVLENFIIENYASITYEIIPENKKCFIDGDRRIFEWTSSGETHAIPLYSNMIEHLRVLFLLLDSGAFTRESCHIPDMETLRTNHLWRDICVYCGKLGIIGDAPVIPVPSKSLEIDESTARFSSAIWFENIKEKVVTLAGVGGIGSYVALLLSRMKPKSLLIYDDDRVEMVNMAGQLYCQNDIGFYKVDAISAMIRNYSAYHDTFAIRDRFTKESEASDIMICGFDNMEARETFFQSWVDHVKDKSDEEKKHCLFIDGRLAAEEFQVLCIRGDDSYNINRYASEFLFSDSEADETLCSYKQTSYMANMIGSIIVNLFTNFAANEIVEGLRDLPFFTSYDGGSMMFKTEQ